MKIDINNEHIKNQKIISISEILSLNFWEILSLNFWDFCCSSSHFSLFFYFRCSPTPTKTKCEWHHTSISWTLLLHATTLLLLLSMTVKREGGSIPVESRLVKKGPRNHMIVTTAPRYVKML
jgi:hypothetical protein